ncbi:MAG: phage/plasmid primase, P4 family [Planctomycetaceae bacterium]|nr:phage/plasmid primase, P4 family [Planctomycetaceae bacterium]
MEANRQHHFGHREPTSVATPGTGASAPTDVFDAALRIRASGVSILPIDHRTKRPLNRLLPRDENQKPTWSPYLQAIVDEETACAWFRSGSALSYAIVAGHVSGDILVLDFETAELYEEWRILIGDLAVGLPVQRSGSGGYHVFCRCPEPGENAKLAWIVDETEKTGRRIGIETRAEGGYILASPSLHPSGNRYEMVSGDLTQIPLIPQARADALTAAARKLDRAPHTRQERERIEREAATAHQRRAAASRNGAGSVIEQFNQAHPIDAILERHCYTRSGDRFIRPGGKSASVSVKDGRSCHFSSNDPLNDGKVKSGIGVHDAFDVYVHLEHGGYVKAAVKEAARSLGIEPAPPSGGTTRDGGVWTPRPDDIIEFPEPMRLAEHYLRARRTGGRELTLRRLREQWWAFDHGYRQLPDEVARVDVYQHIDRLWTPVRDSETGEPTGEFRRVIARSAIVSEVTGAIPACGALVDGDLPQWLDQRDSPKPADVVAFRNGLLDTAKLANDRIDLIPTTPLWFAGVACPYDFDPNAVCPNWLAFLQQVFDGDDESIALLQEWFGLNLVPDNQYESLLMLVGPPRSGKGTVLEMLGAVLGDGQAATTSFTKLASRFGLAPLVGKLAAILPDAHVASHTDSKAALEVLKSITGNDPQAIDRKGIDELPRLRLFCRFSIAVNELPKLPDEAGAIKTRLRLLHFRNSYAGREDTTLKTRLKLEAPGVAVWALEGLKRLRANGKFTLPARSAAMVAAFERIVSPVLGFLDECCEVTGDDSIWTEKESLYEAWCAWSKDRGSEPGTKADFGQSLVNANKGISAAKRGPRGQQFPVYTGVRQCN